MLLDLLGTNDPEPTIVSSQQSTHVSLQIISSHKFLMGNSNLNAPLSVLEQKTNL
jgi:hypothetical protein